MADQRRQHRVDPVASPFALVWEDRGTKLSVLRRTAKTNTGFRPGAAVVQATPACIIADGEDKPLVFCASGWRPQTSGQTSSNMLDGARWTELVRRFAALSPQTRLPRSFRDTPKSPVHVPENSGRYYACHTEKKLALYFLVQQMKFTGVGLRETLAGRLRSAPLPPNRRGATIVLGHKPCKNCRVFLHFIRLRTGIALRTQPCPIYVEHEGRPVAFKGGKPTERAGDGVGAGVDACVMLDDGDLAADQDVDVGMDDAADDDDDDDNDDDPDALDVVEALLAHAPTGNVTRPRTSRGRDNDNDKSDDAEEEERPIVPATPQQHPSHSPVIRDTPEPSLSLSLSLTPDRRHRFSPYETPTQRRRRRRAGNDDDDDDDAASSVAPPAVWHGRSKPPVTPSMQPPPWLLADGSNASDDGDGPGADTTTADAAAAEVSYHFATPSNPSREGTSDGQEMPPPEPEPEPEMAAPLVRPVAPRHRPHWQAPLFSAPPPPLFLSPRPFAAQTPRAAWQPAQAGLLASPLGLLQAPEHVQEQRQPMQQATQQATTPRRAAAQVIDLTDDADDQPVVPTRTWPPGLARLSRLPLQPLQPLPRRPAAVTRATATQGIAARARTRRRGAVSGPLVSSAPRRRFPSLDRYRYTDVPYGHV